MAERIRVLVVDDFAAFRRLVRWILQDRLEMRVVGEAVDGLDAVNKVQELQPDLVILDIGLPLQSGMEAAREIGNIAPCTKIVFLSENHFVEMMREALKLGSAFVVKCDAMPDLPAALDAVLTGKRFVSRSAARHNLV